MGAGGDSDIEELDEAEDEEDDLMGDGEEGEEEEEESEEGMQSLTFWLHSVLFWVKIGCNSHNQMLMLE